MSKLINNLKKVQENKVTLDKKLQSYLISPNNQFFLKNPTIIYDSDWIEPGLENIPFNGAIEPDKLNSWPKTGNQDIYISQFYSATKGQRTRFYLRYTLNPSFKISEQYLPYIKPILLVNKVPEVELESIIPIVNDTYESNYYELYGDSTLIYKGYFLSLAHITFSSARHYLFSESERLLGNFSSALSSKWFYGSMTWTYNGDTYEIINGYILDITTRFMEDENESRFSCLAIDNITASTVTGTGSYIYFGGSQKHYTMSAPIGVGAGKTLITLDDSAIYYKNGVLYHPLSSLFTVDSIVSMNMSQTSPTGEKYWKLWYDDKRAVEFIIDSSSWTFSNLPTKYDYQTLTLPYTKLYFKVNNNPHPETINSLSGLNTYSKSNMLWIKKDTNYFELNIYGQMLLSAPATQQFDIWSQNFVDEYWNQYDHTPWSYYKVNTNRTPTLKPMYKPDYGMTKFRMLLILNNFKTDNSFQNYNLNEKF